MDKDTFISWLQKYWFLGAFLVASGMAWSENTIKIQSIEDAIKKNAETQTKVEVLDERTKSIKEEQAVQRKLLEQILINQHREYSRVR